MLPLIESAYKTLHYQLNEYRLCTRSRLWVDTNRDRRAKELNSASWWGKSSDQRHEGGVLALNTESELRQKLRKIAALYEGATTAGERDAAAAALDRIRIALSAAEQVERFIEMSFRLPDHWNRRLFLALCRRYGIKPYRYARQRHSTVVLRAPESFIRKTLLPEFEEISRALNEYLDNATEQIIREEVFGDAGEAEEKVETPKRPSAE